MGAALPYVADALVIFGVVVVTVGVYGLVRLPDTYTRLHAASKVASLGVILLLLASTATGEAAVVFRVALISAFLVVTTPVSAHVIARAAYLRGEEMRGRQPLDESSDPDDRRD